MTKYEVAEIMGDGTICRGGIPTSKSHAQQWANQNSKLHPNDKFTVVEYQDED